MKVNHRFSEAPVSSGSEFVDSSSLAYLSAVRPEAQRFPTYEARGTVCTTFRGIDALLDFQPQLVELAKRCGQAGSADHLDYFMSGPQGARKTPHLILFHEDIGGAGHGKGELTAAVVLFEYDWIVRSRVFGTFDWTGRRNVFAPSGKRAEIALKAMRALLDNGARMVHISVCEQFADERQSAPPQRVGNEGPGGFDALRHDSIFRGAGPGPGLWTSLRRSVPLYLRIHSAFDLTLAEIHKKTRSNLRYYRRLSERELGSRFVPDARLTLAEFLDFNQQCTFAISAENARFRYESMQKTPGHFLRGMVDDNGMWLSIVGGRKYGRSVELDWQMNRADRSRYSLSTVMRAYLLEHEGLLGSTRFFIEGGTPSPLGHSFTHETVEDFVAKRASPGSVRLEKLYRRLLPEKNYLGQMIRNPNLNWNSV